MSSAAAEIPLRTFAELDLIKLDQQIISIRGFLYKTADQQWILAADPDLKSCCVGAKNKARRQIYLEGELALPQQPVLAITLQGRFHYQREGPPYYWLSEVAIVSKSDSWGAYSLLGIALVALTFVGYFRKIASR